MNSRAAPGVYDSAIRRARRNVPQDDGTGTSRTERLIAHDFIGTPMTYLEFHLYFNLPLILLLLWLGRKRLTWVHARWIGALCLIVLGFTFPWDNWAVGEKIWEFEDRRVLFRVLNLPIEEIMFFVIETIAVCLVALHFLEPRIGANRGARESRVDDDIVRGG